MQLFLYNTLSRKKEIFNPINKDLVKIYVCGPTVYDFQHIGNARSVVVYDVLYRMLVHIFNRESVLYIRNITDVDDKIIKRAKDKGIKISDLTERTIREFHHDMRFLNCLPPNIEPRVTMHISDIIKVIEKLLNNNCAYIVDNHVYFNILKAKNYTVLSGRNLDEMIPYIRIKKNEYKNHPGDFVLWKPANQDESLDANFASPWGIGRPGWHIECSAMSYRYLGENFDIHGGGVDLIFPHHTNEIAQTTCAFKDLVSKKISGDVIRLLLLSTHYRKPLDFSDKALHDATKIINYWYRAIENIRTPFLDIDMPQDFLNALLDDMNTSVAIKLINDYAKDTHKVVDVNEKLKNASKLITCAKFLGLMNISVS